jgi:hypothetical protein
MKKTLLFACLVFAVGVFPAYAKTEVSAQVVGQQKSGNTVSNQNQLEIQNQGEDTMVVTRNQEEESLQAGMGESVAATRGATQKVQELLQIRTTGTVGEQVRELAMEHGEVEGKIEQSLIDAESKHAFLKFLFGPDYDAVRNLKEQHEQNQLRIQKLEQLETQLYNAGDKTMVQEAVQALVEQNTVLQDAITAQEETRSLFGWLVRLLTGQT